MLMEISNNPVRRAAILEILAAGRGMLRVHDSLLPITIELSRLGEGGFTACLVSQVFPLTAFRHGNKTDT